MKNQSKQEYILAIGNRYHGGDKAEKFHDTIFQNQAELNAKKEAFLKDAAKKTGADMKKLEQDLKDPSIMARISKDMEEAKKFNITGTPGFIINGVYRFVVLTLLMNLKLLSINILKSNF